MPHTATPWKHVYGHDTHKVKRDAAGRMLGPVTMDLDDYDHAIHCVNTHEALVEALEECKTDNNANCIVTNDVAYMIRRFKAINKIVEEALAKARQ